MVELSMISIYSCITKLKLNPDNLRHHRRFSTTFTIVNDLVAVNRILPRVLTVEDIALLRHHSDTGMTKHYKFRPYKIFRALKWLKANNPLYKDYVFIWEDPIHQNNALYDDFIDIDLEANRNKEMNPPYIDLTDEDMTKLNNELENSIATTTQGAMADVELQQENEILLMTPDDKITHEETIKNVINSDFKRIIFERPKCDYEFVTPISHPEYFWAKCFPCLFPFGQGCPNDPNTMKSLNDIGKFTKTVLQRGGGPHARRFQQCPSFYFAVYHYVTRYRVQGMTYVAQNGRLDSLNDEVEDLSVNGLTQIIEELQELQENVSLDPEIISTINDTIESLTTTSGNIEDTVTNTNTNTSSTNDPNISTNSQSSRKTLSKQEIKHYLNRLSVYAKILKGTSLYIQNERNKLMAMLASQDITSEGVWRWFLTITPNDLYDSRFYEILAGQGMSWEDNSRAYSAKQFPLEKRKEILVNHPALAARLFDIKLKCIFEHVLKGSSLL
jgi:Helitron helicase-like domain at N-terminus